MAHYLEVVGSNPGTVYWMDVSDLLAITLKEKLKIKVAKWGKPKKNKTVWTKIRSPRVKERTEGVVKIWLGLGFKVLDYIKYKELFLVT